MWEDPAASRTRCTPLDANVAISLFFPFLSVFLSFVECIAPTRVKIHRGSSWTVISRTTTKLKCLGSRVLWLQGQSWPRRKTSPWLDELNSLKRAQLNTNNKMKFKLHFMMNQIRHPENSKGYRRKFCIVWTRIENKCSLFSSAWHWKELISVSCVFIFTAHTHTHLCSDDWSRKPVYCHASHTLNNSSRFFRSQSKSF